MIGRICFRPFSYVFSYIKKHNPLKIFPFSCFTHCFKTKKIKNASLQFSTLSASSIKVAFKSNLLPNFSTKFDAALKTKNKQTIRKVLSTSTQLEFDEYLKNHGNVTLVIGKQHLAMSKELLACFFPYFKELFKNTNDKKVVIPVAHADALRAVLDFAFFKKLKIHLGNIFILLECADFYGLKSLRRHCATWVNKHLKKFDLKDLFPIAVQYQLESTKKLLMDKLIKKAVSGFSNHDIEMLKSWAPYIHELKLKKICPANSYAKLFKHLTELTDVKLNLMDGNLFPLLYALKKIKNFDLRMYKMVGSQVNKPQNFTDRKLPLLTDLPISSLKLLYADGITNYGLKYLPPTLKSLTLSPFPLTQEGVDNLPASLTDLELPGCSLGKSLHFPSSIKYLNLMRCNNTHCEGLKNLTNLQGLNLFHTKIPEDALDFLPNSLEALILGYNDKISDASMAALQNIKLKQLSIDYLPKITDKGFRCLPKSLEELHLKHTFPKKFNSLPKNLSELKLANCSLPDAAMKQLPKKLKTLKLQECSQLTDQCLQHLPSSLQSLHIVKCPGISATAVAALKIKTTYN